MSLIASKWTVFVSVCVAGLVLMGCQDTTEKLESNLRSSFSKRTLVRDLRDHMVAGQASEIVEIASQHEHALVFFDYPWSTSSAIARSLKYPELIAAFYLSNPESNLLFYCAETGDINKTLGSVPGWEDLEGKIYGGYGELVLLRNGSVVGQILADQPIDALIAEIKRLMPSAF